MILPRKDKNGKYYISYSQISSFLKNRKEYIKSYFFNEPIAFTTYIDFGSKVGEALEKNDFSLFSKEEQETLKQVKRLDLFEKEIALDFGEFYVKGFIDTVDRDLSMLIDYKTGALNKIKEYEKDEYIQLILYALGIEQEIGKLPEKLQVQFIERVGNPFKGEPLKIGDNIVEINIELTQERINAAKELVLKVTKEISDLYTVFLKLNK